MQLENRTEWRTTDLRSLIVRCAKYLDLAAPRGRRRVRIATSRRGYVRGYASLGRRKRDGWWNEGLAAWLWLPAPTHQRAQQPGFFAEVAWLVQHELAHNAGQEHGHMHRGHAFHDVHGADTPPTWAAGLQLRPKLVVVRTPPTAAQRREAKLVEARAALARWERKLKLAQTKVKKYRRRIAALERPLVSVPLAASPKETAP